MIKTTHTVCYCSHTNWLV